MLVPTWDKSSTSDGSHIHAGTWGLHPRIAGYDLEEVHPDDRLWATAKSFHSCLFRVLSRNEEYLELEGADGRFRVKPKRFRQVDPPRFTFGELVQTSPPRSLKVGVVSAILWHFKENQAYYLIEVDGKKVSRRYWAEELQKALE